MRGDPDGAIFPVLTTQHWQSGASRIHMQQLLKLELPRFVMIVKILNVLRYLDAKFQVDNVFLYLLIEFRVPFNLQQFCCKDILYRTATKLHLLSGYRCNHRGRSGWKYRIPDWPLPFQTSSSCPSCSPVLSRTWSQQFVLHRPSITTSNDRHSVLPVVFLGPNSTILQLLRRKKKVIVICNLGY